MVIIRQLGDMAAATLPASGFMERLRCNAVVTPGGSLEHPLQT
ncbi:MAG: hypothetical protein WBC89_00690 [Dehalococcoidia bacterium]